MPSVKLAVLPMALRSDAQDIGERLITLSELSLMPRTLRPFRATAMVAAAALFAGVTPWQRLSAQTIWNAPQALSPASFATTVQCFSVERSGNNPACVYDETGTTTLRSATGEATGWSRSSATIGGPLRVESRLSVTNSLQSGWQMFGRVGYFETLTISGAVMPASVRFTMEVDGTWDPDAGAAGSQGIAAICNNFANPFTAVNCNNNPNQALRQFGVTVQGVSMVGMLDVPIRDGVNNLRIGFSAISRVARPQGQDQNIPWSGTAYADFMNTAYVRGVNFLDAQGNDISSQVQAQWGSGVSYAILPEPSTYALMIMGLCAIGAARRASKRRG